ncbi:enolase C-terminal domain-like protein [Mesorhizobium loti]|uniref:enolase C-terminal domain-like protein n=1 Tax=Rhizobium loti TaxID=381 RepID=UPI003CCC881F
MLRSILACLGKQILFRPLLARNGVVLVEQPFAPEEDQRLDHLPHPVPLCADESCRDAASLDGLRNRYKCISIKLEKAGGLTEALAVLRRARELRFGVMVSCMISLVASVGARDNSRGRSRLPGYQRSGRHRGRPSAHPRDTRRPVPAAGARTLGLERAIVHAEA